MSDDEQTTTPAEPWPQTPPREDDVGTGVEEAAEEGEEAPDGGWHFIKELPILIVIAFGLALLIKTFLAQAFFIPSESMVPTLVVDDRVLVNKLVYRFREPRRGEIIVFVAEKPAPKPFLGRVRSFLTEGLGVVTPEEQDFIKRVIALPGETIRVDGRGRVFITPAGGSEPFRLREPYLAGERDQNRYGPFTVPTDSYFVMGDNRAHSSDSRVRGPVHREDIIGKAFLRLWPPGRVGFFRRPAYNESPAQGRGPPAWPVTAGPAVGWAPWSPMDGSRINSAMRGST
jgi:signal peptidase I